VGLLIGYDTSQMNLLYILGFNQVVISLILYLRSNISGLHFFKTDSVISVLDRFLMILFCSVLIWGHLFKQQITIYWFVYCQTIAYSVTAIVAFIIVVRKANFRRIYWNPRFFYVVLKQSMPFALLVLLMTFYNRIDSVMIERLLPDDVGAYQTGVYASAYRLLDATNMIAYLFSVILLPVFARMIKLREPVNEMVQLSVSLLITISIIVSFVSIAYRYEIMTLLYPKHEYETISQFYTRIREVSFVFGALMSCFVAISTTYIFGTLLTANGSLRLLNFVAAGGMVVNILINLVLIPRFMASGSAVTSVITQFGTAIVQMVIAIRIFNLKIKKDFVIRFILFIATIFLLYYLINFINFRWDIKLLLLAVVSLLSAFALKVINIHNILKMFTLKDIIKD
jgi:O-antigen/teichoic acid export membrane protein